MITIEINSNACEVTVEPVTVNVQPTQHAITIYTTGVFLSGGGGGPSTWGSITGNIASQTDLQLALGAKVDKVSGKQLSTEDFTTAEKTKLSGISIGADVSVQADYAENNTSAKSYVKNKPTLSTVATSGSYSDLSDKPSIPTKTSELNNDSGFVADALYAARMAAIEKAITLATDPTKGVRLRDDFMLTVGTLSASAQIGNSYYYISSGQLGIVITDTLYGNQRAAEPRTHIWAAGIAGVIGLTSLRPSYGCIYFKTRLRIPTLSVSAQRFIVTAGAQDGVTATVNDGFGFRYVDNVNGGKWLLWAKSSATGAETTLDSGVAPVADTWATFEIVPNADCTTLGFFINGLLVGSISDNIPTAATLNSVAMIQKTNGTTSRTIQIDNYDIYQIYL